MIVGGVGEITEDLGLQPTGKNQGVGEITIHVWVKLRRTGLVLWAKLQTLKCPGNFEQAQ